VLHYLSEAIVDALADLTAAAATLGSSLHPRTAGHLAKLVRIMNTYFSNLMGTTRVPAISNGRWQTT
jgi:hypothetical protein